MPNDYTSLDLFVTIGTIYTIPGNNSLLEGHYDLRLTNKLKIMLTPTES